MTVPVARKRVKHAKTRTGCKTCRLRRIKCDEARPACRRCSSTGRHCLGYEMSLALIQGQNGTDRKLLPQGDSLANAKSIPKHLATFPTGLNQQEVQAFDFFRKQTLYFLPGCADTTTWETIAMQLAHTEPALSCAIVAVGSMHQARTTRPVGSIMPVYEPAQFEFAVKQYSRAVAHIQSYIDANKNGTGKDTVEVILLACLMFICFELLHGNNFLGICHLQTALKILYEHLHGPIPDDRNDRKIILRAEPRSTMDLLSEIYVKLDCDATMFGQPEPFLVASLPNATEEDVCPMPKVFQSLDEARLHLDALTSAMYCAKGELLRLAATELKAKRDVSKMDEDQINCLVQGGSRSVDLSQQPKLREHLSALERAAAGWSSALASMPSNPEHSSHQVRLLLEIQFFVIWYFSSTWLDRTEVAADRFNSTFSYILGQIEGYLDRVFQGSKIYLDDSRTRGPLRKFALSHSVLLPLFLIASQCRNSEVRRRALLIPSRLHIQESMMDSDLLAACLGRIIDMEEAAARRINGFPPDKQLTCDDVPEAARFVDSTLAGRVDDVGGRLVCCFWADPKNTELTLEEHDFSINDIAASIRDVSRANGDSPSGDEHQANAMQQWMEDYKFREVLYMSYTRRQVLY